MAKNVAFISGPSLGHVVRIVETANALGDIADVDITIVSPGQSPYIKTMVDERFKVLDAGIPERPDTPKYELLAGFLETLFAETKFDAVVHDMCPVQWLATVRFPDCPRVNITDIFLTGGVADTFQSRHFEQIGAQLNQIRAAKGLKEFTSPFEFYDADLVLYADPMAIVQIFGALRPGHVYCGPITPEGGGDIPDDLAGIEDLLILSMGSSGRSEMDTDLLSEVIRSSGCSLSIYVGSRAAEVEAENLVDRTYSWLPLDLLMGRTRAVVTQGGTGSTYQALMRGVPAIVYPTHINQLILGKILQEMKAGFEIVSPGSIDRIRNADFAELRRNAAKIAEVEPEGYGARKAAAEIVQRIF
jgi:hypothetical protein